MHQVNLMNVLHFLILAFGNQRNLYCVADGYRLEDEGEIKMAGKKEATRKASKHITVYCLPTEKELIEQNAKKAGKSASSYLLEVGQGYQITGITDLEQVRELARVNGDLGRLGGLLKLWLTDDKRVANFGKGTVVALLEKIEEVQDEMSLLMKSIVRPRAE